MTLYKVQLVRELKPIDHRMRFRFILILSIDGKNPTLYIGGEKETKENKNRKIV